jgi:hypothetical protein
MVKKDAANKKINLGLGVLLVILLASLFYLINREDKISKTTSPTETETSSETSPQENLQIEADDLSDDSNWYMYVNEEYKFSFYHPRLPFEEDFKNEGSYEYFLNLQSEEDEIKKGIYLGIKENNLDEEIARLKSIFEAEGGELVSETEVDVDGIKGVLVVYKPIDNITLEQRSLVVFEKDGLAYSISTSPDQIDKLISTFKFY